MKPESMACRDCQESRHSATPYSEKKMTNWACDSTAQSIGIAILTTPTGSHESRVNGLSRKEKWRVASRQPRPAWRLMRPPLRPSRPPGTSANPRSIAMEAHCNSHLILLFSARKWRVHPFSDEKTGFFREKSQM